MNGLAQYEHVAETADVVAEFTVLTNCCTVGAVGRGEWVMGMELKRSEFQQDLLKSD